MKIYLLVFLSFFLLVSCSDPEKKKIEEFNSKNNLEVEVLNYEFGNPVTAQDSFQIFQDSLKTKVDSKLYHLNIAISFLDTAIQSGEQGLESNPNGFLAQIFKSEIEESKKLREELEQKIEIYNGDCKGTDLEELYKRVEHFQTLEDSIFFQTIVAELKNQDGSSFRRLYLLDPSKSKIVGYVD
jgi:DNA-binding protein Fis